MLQRVVLVALALLELALCQQNPTISYISKERVVNIGDTTELECSVQYAQSYPVLWVRIDPRHPESPTIISTGGSVIVPELRFSIRHDDVSSTFSLLISKIQETDTGLYQCQVATSAIHKITADVWLHVRIPPIISDNSTRSIITSTGANASLECYADGFPPPRITWRRENNDLLPTGGAIYRGNVLSIFGVTKDDRGTYYCIADNRVGKGARRNVGVEVEFPPVVTADRSRYGQALQYPMDLMCHVEAFPSPSIQWWKDGYQISDNQHYRISIFATADEFTDSVLRAVAIEKKQYGNYTCRAINKLGSSEIVINLFETVNVVCPPACGAQYLTGSATTAVISGPAILILVVAVLRHIRQMGIY
ncbi:lachesin-like [Varroa jacobsoni]|uniref:lachesin-like n=1 Tax=Varroa jacobsoni TaxID=62625 RepID=UPI000BF2BECC|nr:lachesin-like [Varroa jacobsoni]XP_022705562.1 lachesin-like [Varroa jacobsoni]XP_022705563.1 lachesin-like [Varroa jacobsoni]